MMRFGPRRLTLDLLMGGPAWVRSIDTPSGPRVVETGVERASAREILAAHGKPNPLMGPVRCDVVLRGPEVRIERVNLPGVKPAVAERVARRRTQDAAEEDPTGATLLSSLILTERESSSLWLMTANRSVCEAEDLQIGFQGVEADRFVPQALALGALNRLLSPTPSDGLTAVLWVDREGATCVVADRFGWLFDRAIPLRYASDAAEDEGGDGSQYVERLGTELDRTFTYVKRDLNLGDVTRVRLCGLADDLAGLSATLSTSLGLEVDTLENSHRRQGDPQIPSRAGAALGAAMLPRSARVANLLPQTAQRLRRAARVRRPLKVALAGAALVSMGAGTTGFTRYRVAHSELVRVRAEAARWEVEREGLQGETALRIRAEQIRAASTALLTPEPPFGDMLVLLGDALPDSLFIRQLDLEQESAGWKLSASLEGEAQLQAEAANAVAELRKRLDESGLFRVALLETEAAPAAGQEWTSFRYRLVAWVASQLTEQWPP